jgi:diaminopimelate decarboxylase
MDKRIYERPIIVKQYSGMMNKFGSAPSTLPLSEIDGIPVKQLAQDWGSPRFVMSEKKIRENQRRLYRIFKSRYPSVQMAWSYKTNYLNAVCSVVSSGRFLGRSCIRI